MGNFTYIMEDFAPAFHDIEIFSYTMEISSTGFHDIGTSVYIMEDFAPAFHDIEIFSYTMEISSDGFHDIGTSVYIMEDFAPIKRGCGFICMNLPWNSTSRVSSKSQSQNHSLYQLFLTDTVSLSILIPFSRAFRYISVHFRTLAKKHLAFSSWLYTFQVPQHK